MLEHTIDDMHQLAHHRSYHHLLGFAPSCSPLGIRLECRASPHRRDRWLVQCLSHSNLPHLRHPRPSPHRRSRFKVAWCHPRIRRRCLGRGGAFQVIELCQQFGRRDHTNANDRGQQLEVRGQFAVRLHMLADRPLHLFQLLSDDVHNHLKRGHDEASGGITQSVLLLKLCLQQIVAVTHQRSQASLCLAERVPGVGILDPMNWVIRTFGAAVVAPLCTPPSHMSRRGFVM